MIYLKLIAAAVAVGLVFAVALYWAICHARRTCGNCDFCDVSLTHCWKRGVKVDTEHKACKEYGKRDKI